MKSQPIHLQETFNYLSSEDEAIIQEAYELVRCTQTRSSLPTIVETSQVLFLLSAWKLSLHAVLVYLASAILRCKGEFSKREADFFEREILSRAEKTHALYAETNPQADSTYLQAFFADRLRRMFLLAYIDIEIVLICVAIHHSKMTHIEVLTYREAHPLLQENEDVYLLLAEMLGMWDIRRELGDLGLKRLNPKKIWEKIRHKQEQVCSEQTQIFVNINTQIGAELNQRGIKGDVVHHLGTISSIYRRLCRGEALEELIQMVKIDVIVDTEEQCYQLLRIIHSLWPPIVGRSLTGSYFRDLIASPKFNGYRALITTVAYPLPTSLQGKTKHIEFRILTHEMVRTNGEGIIAARFLSNPPIRIKNAWWGNEENRSLVVASLENDDTPQIYVYSPTGELIKLPKNSTPVDFAFRIHTEVGYHSKSFWVNGRSASYGQQLHNMDLVKVIVDPLNPGMDSRWLSVVTTPAAKAQIERALRKRGNQMQKGRKIILKTFYDEVRAYGNPGIGESDLDLFLEKIVRLFNFPDLNALYIALATPHEQVNSLRITPQKIITHLFVDKLSEYIVREDGQPLGIPKNIIKFIQCQHNKTCRVSPKAPIIGRLIQKSTGFSQLIVYRSDCPNAPTGDNIFPLRWLEDRRSKETFKLSINAVDKPGLLREVLNVLYTMYAQNLYILEVHAIVSRDQSANISITVEADGSQISLQSLQQMDQLKNNGTIDDFRIESLSYLEKMLLTNSAVLSNPYTTGPARSSRLFKGRDDEVKKIMSCLGGEQNIIVLYGINRVGKTSFLFYLKDHLSEKYNYVPVLLNMADIPKDREDCFWLELAKGIEQSISKYYGKKQTTRTQRIRTVLNPMENFQEWLLEKKENVKNVKLLIMIDEFSVVDEMWTHQEAIGLVYRLKSLAEKEGDIVFVLCVQEGLIRNAFSDPDKRNITSIQLLRLGFPIHLGHLDNRAAEKLIREPVGKMLDYEDRVVERILLLTDCHPFLLQHLLIRIVDYANSLTARPLKISEDDLYHVLPKILSIGNQLFYSYLHEFQGIHRLVLSALAELSGPEFRKTTVSEVYTALAQYGVRITRERLTLMLEQLCEKDILERDVGDSSCFSFHIPLFAAWLREYHPLRSTASEYSRRRSHARDR